MRRLIIFTACVFALVLGACSSGDGFEVAPPSEQVSGTVLQPAGALAALGRVRVSSRGSPPSSPVRRTPRSPASHRSAT